MGFTNDIKNVHARLDLLARCFGDQCERLSRIEKRLDVLDDIDNGLDERVDTMSTRFDALEQEKSKHFEEQENLEYAFDRRICRLEHEQHKREEKITNQESRIDALELKMADMHTKDEPKLGLSGLDFELCRLTDRIRKVELREDAQVNCNASLQWHITEQKIRIDKIEALLNAIREALQSKKEVRE